MVCKSGIVLLVSNGGDREMSTMRQHTAKRIAAMMDKAERAGLVATAGRDDEYGRDWWEIMDEGMGLDGSVLHILVMHDADGMQVSIHEGGKGRNTSLADAERMVEAA